MLNQFQNHFQPTAKALTAKKRSFNLSNASEEAEPDSQEFRLAKRRKLMEDSIESIRAGDVPFVLSHKHES